MNAKQLGWKEYNFVGGILKMRVLPLGIKRMPAGSLNLNQVRGTIAGCL